MMSTARYTATKADAARVARGKFFMRLESLGGDLAVLLPSLQLDPTRFVMVGCAPVVDQISIPGFLPDEVKLGVQLENIFMPQARRQRDQLYLKHCGSGEPRPEDCANFAHYTSAEAALSIIKGKRVWMRNATCMSDYREVQHGFAILSKFFNDKDEAAKFTNTLDACVPNAAKEAIDLFNQWWFSTQFQTYISSISEHAKEEDLHGRLSMWRAFGGNAARVAIVLKMPWFSGGAQALNLIFSPVAYLKEKQVYAVIYEVIENIRSSGAFLRTIERSIIVNSVFSMLVAGVTCLKHEGFHEEAEWRAIYSPKRLASPLMKSSTRVIGGVPQIVYEIPLDEGVSPALAGLDIARTFDRLIIGPTPYPFAMYEAFVEALTEIKVPEPEKRVFTSGIPIRP